MELIADFLMIAGALGAAIYCYVLASRLKKFATLETGMGGAIAVLSVQVDDMTRALEKAGKAATASADGLQALTLRAETAARKLELLIASLHDLPDAANTDQTDHDLAPNERKLRFIRRRTGREDMGAEQ